MNSRKGASGSPVETKIHCPHSSFWIFRRWSDSRGKPFFFSKPACATNLPSLSNWRPCCGQIRDPPTLDGSTRGCQAWVQTLGKQFSLPCWPLWRKRGFPRRLNGTRDPVFSNESKIVVESLSELFSCGATSQVLAKMVLSSSSRNSGSTNAAAGKDSARLISESTKNYLAERILFMETQVLTFPLT